ncbi:Mov34/MPN/PAD-1 family protein [Trichormus azollae]|jgi:proteasome lid subunit RPN8/RPN11|uniref:Mov34/MPN/PAD-1 family protein n=1 Tax=Trichormus azollae TaxID=1164 RepID=UPI0001958075
MHLQLNTNHLQTIKNHPQTTYPDECCGLILGYLSSEYKTVVEVIPTENAWNTEASNFTEETQSTKRRYAIAPQRSGVRVSYSPFVHFHIKKLLISSN